MKQPQKWKTAHKCTRRIQLGVSLLAMTLLSMTLPANATERSFNSTLSKVWSLADGRLILQTSLSSSWCTGSGSPQSYYLAPGQGSMTTDGLKNILAVAMTGIALGKTFGVHFDDTTAYCYITKLEFID
jgi:hypothetical protein